MPVVLGAASAFTSRRLALFGLVSTIAAIAITFNAFRQRPNFYSATVMLGGSNGCMMVLINFGLFLALCFGKICQKIFFGPLRAVEVEHLHERLWYAITETLLAMTIFRDDFDSSFAILFGTLLFLKVFHWLSADRVEYMEQSPSVGRLFHVRMIAILSMLFEFDLFLATFAVEVLIIDKERKGIMIMFANEFFILGATLWSTIAKYLINCQDMRSEEPWEAKSMYVFFVDLITDFLKLATYIACFCLILSYYGGLPLHIFRDVYVTGLSFFSRLRDFMKYRAATRNMDTRFPNATQIDLRSMSDGTCIICREEMIAEEAGGDNQGGEAQTEERRPTPTVPASGNSGLNETPKKLPCGHIFHFHCLRSWLERQQSCPTCRRTVFAPSAAEAQRDQVPGQGEQARQGAAPVPLQAHAENNGNNATYINSSRQEQQRTQPANANDSVRDRLQSFMQSIQTDAQRMRQDHQDRNLNQSQQNIRRQPTQSSSTNAAIGSDMPQSSARPANNTDRTSSPARKMLINSLFAQRSDPLAQLSRTGRRENGESRSSGSVLPPPPILRGLNESGSSRNDSQSDTYIPPAPWTLRSDGRNPAILARSSSSLSGAAESNLQAASTSTDSNEAVKGGSTSALSGDEVEIEETATIDPVDAREAARAAALRRFQKNQPQLSVSQSLKQHDAVLNTDDKPSESSKPVDKMTSGKMSANEQRATPGNPHLIPLFDTMNVQGYAEHHAPNLPYPIIQNTETVNQFGVGRLNRIRSESLNLESLSLSDEELKNLSKETKEGLQERLRLLYRVEETIGSLVEEITRALSAMPNEKETEDVSKAESTQQSGKGKAPAEGIHASAFE